METLFVGNAGYWNEASLKAAFPGDSFVIVCEDYEKITKKKFTSFPVSVRDERFGKIFSNYSFDRVIYVSRYLTYRGEVQGELEELKEVLKLCTHHPVRQVVYLASEEVCAKAQYGRDVILNAAEELCRHYAECDRLPVKIVRCPYLVSGSWEKDYWHRVFASLEEKKEWIFEETESQQANFIDVRDLNEFLLRFFENWTCLGQEINLRGYAGKTFGDAAAWMRKKFPDAWIEFQYSQAETALKLGEDEVRKKLGWFAKRNVIDGLDEYYREYVQSARSEAKRRAALAKSPDAHSWERAGLELVAGALLVEFINRLLQTTVQFQMVDVRLLFVVCMASVHGINVGLIASAIEMVSLGYQYYLAGTNWTLLFYEPSNWLPFILYMSAGSICGYVRMKKEEEVSFLNKENINLREKYDFLAQLYKEALAYKNRYKKQIIGSRDSFGKIFEVVRRLDALVPEKIFAEAVPVLEDILKNRSIAVYSIYDRAAQFARLEVCSETIRSVTDKSLNLEDYREMLSVLETGEVWFNQMMREGYPMYMAGVRVKGKLTVLIMIYRVEFEQVGTHYANLIRILSGLIETSFARAWEFQNTTWQKRHIGDTMIVNEDYFREQYMLRRSMREKNLASFCLLKILREERSPEELDRMLRTRVRSNDLIGLLGDGNIYILMSQVDPESEQTVRKRFIDMGLKCSLVDRIGEA